MPLSSKKNVTRFVHRKLLFRFRRLGIIFLLITGFLFYKISQDVVALYIAAWGFVGGLSVGLLFAKRMHLVSWNSTINKAVTRMDSIGIVILVLYVVFAITRHWIFSYWFKGTSLSACTLSIAAGGLLGRFFTTRNQIRRILKDEGIMKKLKMNDER